MVAFTDNIEVERANAELGRKKKFDEDEELWLGEKIKRQNSIE